MRDRPKALRALKKAISALQDFEEPDQLETVLDAVASTLKPFFEDLPDSLKSQAAPLDALLAYLASQDGWLTAAAKAASRLLETASVERYDGSVVEVTPDEINEEDRQALLSGLESLYGSIEDDEDDDEGV
ncbi:hypothetical protein F0U60_23875 [Archangium minus]|uniref:Uncharacterized protein n=1 Tax=Archangium minus TaxID=83450 RepID=A0ABY9WT29_9BACT|nr:hypothetical protein F0U60_23875 [Archangium minus]